MPVQNNCKYCDEIYFHKPSRKDSKFCSRICQNRFNGPLNAIKLSTKIELSCAFCSKKFKTKLSRKNYSKYCSRKCMLLQPPKERKQRKIRTCKVCNKEFRYLIKESKPNGGIFCSNSCKFKANNGIKKGSWLDNATYEEKLASLKIRYEKYVIKKEGCWDWKGARTTCNYGSISFAGKQTTKAHRASWLIYNGKIENNLHVLHKCDNPPCTNPDHLYLGTHKDNMNDMFERDRAKNKDGTIRRKKNGK